MKNAFTNYLLSIGWIEAAPMSYKRPTDDLEIFFDTSSQIEIYRSNRRIKNVYLQDLPDLVQALKDIDTDLQKHKLQ